MNHARWSIDFINRQRHRTSERVQDQTLTKPKSIIDLILEQNESKQPQGSFQNSNERMKKVLEVDEAQLDITLNQRGKIFKERTVKELKRKDITHQPETVYRNFGIKTQVQVSQDELRVLPPPRKKLPPVHEQAQR